MEEETKKDYLKKLWEAFEQTGSISAYILYCDVKKQMEEKKEYTVTVKN